MVDVDEESGDMQDEGGRVYHTQRVRGRDTDKEGQEYEDEDANDAEGEDEEVVPVSNRCSCWLTFILTIIWQKRTKKKLSRRAQAVLSEVCINDLCEPGLTNPSPIIP